MKKYTCPRCKSEQVVLEALKFPNTGEVVVQSWMKCLACFLHSGNGCTVTTTAEAPAMDAANAFQVVLDLARQNLIDPRDNQLEYDRQLLACKVIEDLAVNHFGD